MRIRAEYANPSRDYANPGQKSVIMRIQFRSEQRAVAASPKRNALISNPLAFEFQGVR